MIRRALSLAAVLAWVSPATASAAGPSFAAATRGEAPRACPAGSFIDLRLDDPSKGAECWRCPEGTVRTLEPVTSPRACTQPSSTTFDDAKFEHSWTCDGSKREFYDPRKGGECWSCPKNRPRRTAYAVTSKKACATKELIGEKLSEANYEHKAKGCTGRSFFDPRKGGECWSCPSGYTRTAEAVTSKKACAKDKPETLRAAQPEGHLGCRAGEFLDPRGECWSCPKGHPYRTINPVDTAKACTDELLGVLAADAPALCRSVLSAVGRTRREGSAALESLQAAVDPLIAPVKEPLMAQVDAMTALISAPEELRAPIERLEASALGRGAELAASVGAAAPALADALLREGTCTDAIAAVDERLSRALKLPASLARQVVSISVGVTFTHPTYRATMTVALTWVTNFSGDGGLLVSVGLGATSAPEPFGVGVSAMYYPGARLDDFGLSAAPGIGVSIAKGGTFEELFKGKELILGAVSLIDGVDVAWSPETPMKLPSLGVSKGVLSVGKSGTAVVALTAVAGWDFPLLSYRDGKRR